MLLEDIVKMYGMVDYYDPVTCMVYMLSHAIEERPGSGILIVPVKDALNGAILGCVSMVKAD